MVETFPWHYPEEPLVRRHGPSGYTGVESFRAWLRDDFCFRCVYCLHRERFTPGAAAFALDHIRPRSLRPDLALEYGNLAYACAACNSLKLDTPLPGPDEFLYGKSLAVKHDGTIAASDSTGRRLVNVLRLDRPRLTEFRRTVIATLALAARHDPELWLLWMAFPENLPDLGSLRPPANKNPEGILTSWFALREHGLLPAWY